jgi:hypothetical protein
VSALQFASFTLLARYYWAHNSGSDRQCVGSLSLSAVVAISRQALNCGPQRLTQPLTRVAALFLSLHPDNFMKYFLRVILQVNDIK